jgi:hypothetical protein
VVPIQQESFALVPEEEIYHTVGLTYRRLPVNATSLPFLLSAVLPTGDNTAPGFESSWNVKRFGPRKQRLEDWGQYFDEERVFSCVSPDLAAIKADPLQLMDVGRTTENHTSGCPRVLSQHFWWGTEEKLEQDVEWFYNEITVRSSAENTFFMTNGFYGGYFGIQEHKDRKRFAIFSLWDAGSKVEIVDWGEEVAVGRFGFEGTGANSKLVFPWKVGETVRFLVHVRQEPVNFVKDPTGAKTTLYSGYLHDSSRGIWRLMATFRVKPCGDHRHVDGMLMNMNSFIEFFGYPPKDASGPACNAYRAQRLAAYGPPWYKVRGEMGWKQIRSVVRTTGCPPEGCPADGFSGWSTKVPGGDAEAFVLAVGNGFKDLPGNKGLVQKTWHAILQNQTLSSVLTQGVLPLGDNSPAGAWKAGELRPLRDFGEKQHTAPWGQDSAADFACPWYVEDCAHTVKD